MLRSKSHINYNNSKKTEQKYLNIKTEAMQEF